MTWPRLLARAVLSSSESCDTRRLRLACAAVVSGRPATSVRLVSVVVKLFVTMSRDGGTAGAVSIGEGFIVEPFPRSTAAARVIR